MNGGQWIHWAVEFGWPVDLPWMSDRCQNGMPAKKDNDALLHKEFCVYAYSSFSIILFLNITSYSCIQINAVFNLLGLWAGWQKTTGRICKKNLVEGCILLLLRRDTIFAWIRLSGYIHGSSKNHRPMHPLTAIHYLDHNHTKTMQKIHTKFGGGI